MSILTAELKLVKNKQQAKLKVKNQKSKIKSQKNKEVLFILYFCLLPFAICLLLSSPSESGNIKVEGNFDLSGEMRRDADKEYDDRPLGYDRAFTRNMKRPAWNFEMYEPRAELRAYAYPVAPMEIYAKILHNFRELTDFWIGEAHTKVRFTKDSWDKEKGIESYFFYRQGRLSLGDPILYITYDGFGSGVATSWWLGRGEFTFPKGKWSGEFNLQNSDNDQKNLSGEDNDAYSAKLRHEYKFNTEFNISNEVYFAQKNYWYDAPRYLLYRNYLVGTGFGLTYKSTSLNLQYNLASNDQEGVSLGAADNDAFGLDLRNLVLLDKKWSGRWGVNASFLYYGSRYYNYIGRGPEWIGFGESIQNGSYSSVGDNVSKNLYSELFWDVPKYDINIALRHEDKEGMRLYPGRRLSRRNEINLEAKLIHNLSLRIMANRTLYGLEKILMDFDQNRFIRDRNMRHSQLYTSLKYSRTWGGIMADFHLHRRRSVEFKITGLEASYMFSKKLKILGRSAWMWIDRPDLNWFITNVPSDINAARPTTSVVDPFFSRSSAFLQLQYKPSDNSQVWLEYGQGWHTDDNLSLDANFLDATRRTDPRVFMKMEIWF